MFRNNNRITALEIRIENLYHRVVTLENWQREFLKLSTIEQDWLKELESRMNPDGTYQTLEWAPEIYTAMCAANDEVPIYPKKEKSNEKDQKARATTKGRVKPKK